MMGYESLALRFVLAEVRFAPALLIPAITPFAWAPLMARIGLLSVLGVLTTTAIPGSLPVVHGMATIALMMAGEALAGLVLGLAVMLPMAGIGFAGRLVDLQAGFGAAMLFNPATREQQSLTGRVLYLMAIMVFFATGMHLTLVRGLLTSVRLAPLGWAAMIPHQAPFLALLGSQFLLGLMLVAPIVVGLFGVDVAVAFASRSMPQVNVYFVALPLKVVAAMLLLALSLHFAPNAVEQIYSNAFHGVSRMVGS